jgi:hypothetical protein
MKTINFVLALSLGFSSYATAQLPGYPICGVEDNILNPRFAYFETPPSNSASWSICIRSVPCQGLTNLFPPPQVLTQPNGSIDVNANFTFSGFTICPLPAYYRLTLPPVTGTTVNVRYSTRVFSSVFDPNEPFIFRQELTAGVVSLSPAPSLNLWGVLALVGLVLGGTLFFRSR